MQRYQWALLAALVAAGSIVCLAGCNTIKGIGKDIHDSAQNVQMDVEHSDENYERVDADHGARSGYSDGR